MVDGVAYKFPYQDPGPFQQAIANKEVKGETPVGPTYGPGGPQQLAGREIRFAGDNMPGFKDYTDSKMGGKKLRLYMDQFLAGQSAFGNTSGLA